MATIIQVNGVDIPKEPSEFQISMYDISDDDAGRVNDTTKTMYKQRVGEIHKINIAWNNNTPEEEAAILTAFSDEYLSITYTDPYTAEEVTREFTRGDVSTAIRTWTVNKKRYNQLAFTLEERSVHTN